MKILLHGASGRMGHAILEGLGVDPDTLPDFGRWALIEGEDLLASFDAHMLAKFKEKIANWPDDDPTTWSELKHELNARTANLRSSTPPLSDDGSRPMPIGRGTPEEDTIRC